MTNADLILLNGNVLTIDDKDQVVAAVAVRDGRIQAVGDNAAVEALAGPDTEFIDLAGQTMIPGFVDPHSHFPHSGITKVNTVDLNSPPIGAMNDMADVAAALSAKAAATPAGQWIQGRGYDDTRLAEGRHPTRHDLDKVSSEHPILIKHISGHLGVANTLALELCGVGAETPDPEGGVIRREGNGEPDGVLEETALFSLAGEVPPADAGQQRAIIRAATQEYLSLGITTAQNAAASSVDIAALCAADAAGELPIRVVVFPPAQDILDAKKAGRKLTLPEDGNVDFGAAKLFQDGSIQGYTGYLSKPYHVPFNGDGEYRGYPIYSQEMLTGMVTELQADGWQVAIHGNGDAAIDEILEAFRQAQLDAPRPDNRHIIVHSQMAREDQLDTMAELTIVPSFFILHTYYWGNRHRDIFMGPERARRMSPCGSALKRGLRFTIHCDTPVVPMNPMLKMWAAVNRRSFEGDEIGPDQRITSHQALRAATIDCAWQGHEERDKGSIEVGKRADLAVLSASPLDDPETIKDIKVLRTLVGGKTVFSAA